MKIINESYQEDWFVLPKDLLIEYSERLGAIGISLYAYIAASVDETYVCTFHDSKLTDALTITTLELKEALRLLKDTRLVKYESTYANQTTYTLLWQPCPLEEDRVPSPF